MKILPFLPAICFNHFNILLNLYLLYCESYQFFMLFVLFYANCFCLCGTQPAVNIFMDSGFDFCHFVGGQIDNRILKEFLIPLAQKVS